MKSISEGLGIKLSGRFADPMIWLCRVLNSRLFKNFAEINTEIKLL